MKYLFGAFVGILVMFLMNTLFFMAGYYFTKGKHRAEKNIKYL